MMVYTAKRLMMLIPILIGVSILAFLIMHLIPGDPARVIAGMGASPEDVEGIRQRLGLDRPIHVQYFEFMRGIAQGDLGNSIRTRRPVLTEMLDRYPATINLGGAALAVGVLIGVPAGVVAAVKQYSAFDSMSMMVAIFGLSMPSFWMGLMLVYFLGYRLELLPPSGMLGSPWTWDGMRSLLMPAFTLGTPTAAVLARLSRSSMLEVVRQDYIRTARAKGLKEAIIVLRHALKNALIPVITVAGMQLGYLLGGAVVVETVFAWPGLGRLVVSAIHFRDFPVVRGGVMLFALTFVLVNLLVDLAYGMVDPRIRYA